MKNASRLAFMLSVLLGAGLTITPPPVAAEEGNPPPPEPCDMPVECLRDTFPREPPGQISGPCSVVNVPLCGCIGGPCMIDLQPCEAPSDPCDCVSFEQTNTRGPSFCGYAVDPCENVPANACACVDVPATTSFGRVPTHGGACGIGWPTPGHVGGPLPNPCDGLPADSCGCVSLGSTAPGVHLGALPAYMCGIPTNPCGLVGTGTMLDGCGCVEMGGPTLTTVFASTTITSTAIIPTSVCGFPVDPCWLAGALGSFACECVAQLERELYPNGDTPPFPRILAPPALCIAPPEMPCVEGLTGSLAPISPSGVLVNAKDCACGLLPSLPVPSALNAGSTVTAEVPSLGVQAVSGCCVAEYAIDHLDPGNPAYVPCLAPPPLIVRIEIARRTYALAAAENIPTYMCDGLHSGTDRLERKCEVTISGPDQNLTWAPEILYNSSSDPHPTTGSGHANLWTKGPTGAFLQKYWSFQDFKNGDPLSCHGYCRGSGGEVPKPLSKVEGILSHEQGRCALSSAAGCSVYVPDLPPKGAFGAKVDDP